MIIPTRYIYCGIFLKKALLQIHALGHVLMLQLCFDIFMSSLVNSCKSLLETTACPHHLSQEPFAHWRIRAIFITLNNKIMWCLSLYELWGHPLLLCILPSCWEFSQFNLYNLLNHSMLTWSSIYKVTTMQEGRYAFCPPLRPPCTLPIFLSSPIHWRHLADTSRIRVE